MNTSLQTLYLNDNKLKKFLSLRTKSNASNLCHLDVKRNHIKNITRDEMEPLNQLSYLEISEYRLVEVDFIRYTPGLRAVYLSQNPFPSTKTLFMEARNLERVFRERAGLENFPIISSHWVTSKFSIYHLLGGRPNIKISFYPYRDPPCLTTVLPRSQLILDKWFHCFRSVI